MGKNNHIRITVDGQELDLGPIENLPLRVSYALEDRENFQTKKSSRALNVIVPATRTNDRISNTYHNPGIEDLTDGEVFRSNRPGVIEVNGQELLVGKAFLVDATHDSNPTSYEYNFYGNNGDWIIDLKEATLHDFVKHIKFNFNKITIQNSWSFDGTDKNLPYVFAPVRYGEPMASTRNAQGDIEKEDYSMSADYFRPSLSKYWILYEGFRSLGYKIKSDFLDTPYFRRQVMPWTWGSFLNSEGTNLDNLDFLAKAVKEFNISKTDYVGPLELFATNESLNGAFDNNGVYEYDAPGRSMKWTYEPAFNYGLLEATFHLAFYVDMTATSGSHVKIYVRYYKNGVRYMIPGEDPTLGEFLEKVRASDWDINAASFTGILENWRTIPVMPGDVVTAQVVVDMYDDNPVGRNRISYSVDAWEIDYFRIPLGGDIDFNNYLAFKKYKFLDFLAGIVDEFNLCIQTDSVEKVVYIEPEHSYSTGHDMSILNPGWFNGNQLDWESKQDLSKESKMSLFSDYERELSFKYKDDTNDGTFNIVANRNVNTPALAKYVFPDRFKAGKKEIENRFFSAVMHYDVLQWKGLAANYPQMICLVPENISNTSREVAQNTFQPKSAYYKGVVQGIGWVFDGDTRTGFPYMFAVNYMDGGENDPILSYCDEQIGRDDDNLVTGKGLLRRFYLQRLEIMRNGQYYKTWFNLNNNDIANFLHREYIICRGQKWELVEIDEYNPLSESSTQVYLRKWSPIRHA